MFYDSFTLPWVKVTYHESSDSERQETHVHSNSVSRRDFLMAASAVVGSAAFSTLLAGCGGCRGKPSQSQGGKENAVRQVILDVAKNPKQAERMRHLVDLGFEQAGSSNVFKQGNIHVSVDEEGHAFFVDYQYIDSSEKVQGVQRGKNFGGFSLVFSIQSKNGLKHIEKTLGESGGSMSKQDEPRTGEFAGKSIEQQLVSVGFENDKSSAPGSEVPVEVFRMNVRENQRSHEIIAVTKGGKLLSLVKPIDARVSRHMPKNDTEVLGYATQKNKFTDREFSVLRVSNGTMEFRVSAEYSGDIVEGSQRLLRELTDEELGVKRMHVLRIEDSGFAIGGQNRTEVIRKLHSLAGQSIQKLEARMRPGRDSEAGFLGKGESFKDILAADNDFVLSQGLTHQDIALPLQYIQKMFDAGYGSGSDVSPFSFFYKGCSYTMQMQVWRGMQHSPFDDGTGTNLDVVIVNQTNGKQLQTSLLLPDMIERYGFYEGHGTSYRLDPRKVVDVFPYLKELGKKQLQERNMR